MDIVKTTRNLRLFPQNDDSLADLRGNQWNLYEAPMPIARKILGNDFLFRPGLTLTPFANARACTAHCRFCSEELQRKNGHQLTAKNYIRDYDQYFEGLQNALLDLAGLPIGLSLSGLEATAEPEWLLRLLETFEEVAPTFAFDEKVLYTNGSGLIRFPELIKALQKANFDRIELSRCHFDEGTNQKIMYFNRNEAILHNEDYEKLVKSLNGQLFIKNSCILTKHGISNLEGMESYLDWADSLGVKEVVFRELSRLDDSYIPNATANWVRENRISIDPILENLSPTMSNTRTAWKYMSSTLGYYYYNEHFLYKGKTEVIIETSSYPALMSANQSGIVQKLVFHSNGNLCGDWDPDAHVIGKYF